MDETRPFMPVETLVAEAAPESDYNDGDNAGWYSSEWRPDSGELVLKYQADEDADLAAHRSTEAVFRLVDQAHAPEPGGDEADAGPVTPARVLAVPMADNDSGESTVGGYLAALLESVWSQGEGFDGKRPFGNSGWHYDLHAPLAEAGLVPSTRDRYGDLVVEHSAVDKLIQLAIGALRSPSPVTSEDLLRAALVEDALAARADDEAAHARMRAAMLRENAGSL